MLLFFIKTYEQFKTYYNTFFFILNLPHQQLIYFKNCFNLNYTALFYDNNFYQQSKKNTNPWMRILPKHFLPYYPS